MNKPSDYKSDGTGYQSAQLTGDLPMTDCQMVPVRRRKKTTEICFLKIFSIFAETLYLTTDTDNTTKYTTTNKREASCVE